MNACQYCHAPNPVTQINCLKCTALLPARTSEFPSPIKRALPKIPPLYIGVALASIVLICAIAWVWHSMWTLPAYSFVKSAAPAASPVSTTRTIQSKGGILLAVTEDDFDEMMKAAVAGDDAYLLRMGIDGKLFRLQDGTKIRVVDGGMFKSKVSALEGNQAGRAGWLPNEFISR